MSQNLGTITILRNESAQLIRYELRAGKQRAKLEHAARQAILKGGLDINDVSEATGLKPSEIRTLLDRDPAIDEDLAELAGTR
jgi:hypothetical protein